MESAIAFTLYYLAKHQEVQNKVVKEIREKLPDFEITLDKLNEMKYLKQCILETMRLCPSIPVIARSLNEDVKLGKFSLSNF